MTRADGHLDRGDLGEIRSRHYGEADIPEHHSGHPCDACRLLITFYEGGPMDPKDYSKVENSGPAEIPERDTMDIEKAKERGRKLMESPAEASITVTVSIGPDVQTFGPSEDIEATLGQVNAWLRRNA